MFYTQVLSDNISNTKIKHLMYFEIMCVEYTTFVADIFHHFATNYA